MEKQTKNQNSLNNTEKENLTRGVSIPDLSLYYRLMVTKTAWYWNRNRHIVQWNAIKDPDVNPHTYEHLIFDKEDKAVQSRKEGIFNKWCWHNWIVACRRMQIDQYLSPCIKLKSK